MMNQIISIGTTFLNGPFIPAIISAVGAGYFFVEFRKENKEVNKKREQVQQDLINKATIALPRRTYNVACAGSKDASACEKIQTIDVKACNFLDENKVPIENLDLYNFFIVHGSSMQYAGIHDGDLLFTLADFKLSQISSDVLPRILVLRYRKSEEEQAALKANYKVRRAWLRCSIEEMSNNYSDILRTIVESESFSKLKKEDGYQGDKWMIHTDFPKRLEEYRKYSSNGEYPNEFREVVISTTYDVSENKIHFSIHPISSVVGIVEHSYTLK